MVSNFIFSSMSSVSWLCTFLNSHLNDLLWFPELWWPRDDIDDDDDDDDDDDNDSDDDGDDDDDDDGDDGDDDDD